MTMETIHALLRERFGEAIGEWPPPETGDPWIGVKAEAYHDVARFLRDDPALKFDYLRLVSAVDWMGSSGAESAERLSSVLHLYSFARDHEVTIAVDLPRDAARLASVADLWPAANWHEREAYDMMGIVYEGHPDLRRILLPEDWEGHPLRKDYVQPEEYHGIPNV